jgi:hypothetical protein
VKEARPQKTSTAYFINIWNLEKASKDIKMKGRVLELWKGKSGRGDIG